MARTKRKVNPLAPAVEQTAPQQRIYKAGGYARLSVEDSGKSDADTIEAQKELIKSYIAAQPDMELGGLYCDNGRTGTNFQRPEFERLMEDVRAGKIDCIVVKDLSRFGRNYKETGNFLEQVFPFLGVRFVAVNDSFDTLAAESSQDGYIVPLKNIINEAYSKDISRKVSSALAVKKKAGEFVGPWAAYGYRKCAEDKHRIEPDPATAPIVREIFALRRGGMSFNKIAKRLNDEKISTPAQYRREIGQVKTDRYKNARWNIFTLKSIVENPVYIGHTVQGRKKSGLCQGRKQQRTQKSEWIIVENTHEPLIDEGTFRAVQAMSEQASQAYNAALGGHDYLGGAPNILRGLIFCADCGKPLARDKQVARNGKSLYYVYSCQTHHTDTAACPRKYLHETKLKEVLWTALQREIELCADTQRLLDEYAHSPAAAHRSDMLEHRIAAAERRLSSSKLLFDSLYQNYVDRLLDERKYTELRDYYHTEMERAQTEIAKLEYQQTEQKRQIGNNPWLKTFGQFSGQTELTDELAHALIERVEVYSDDRVEIKLRCRDEYRELARLLGGGEKAVVS